MRRWRRTAAERAVLADAKALDCELRSLEPRMTQVEVAQALGISKGTVQNVERQAFAKIRAHLRKGWPVPARSA